MAPSKKVIASVLEQYGYDLTTYPLYIEPRIPNKILNNAVHSYGDRYINEICGIIDTSSDHSGKSGIMFTDVGIYYKYNSAKWSVSYDCITGIEIVHAGGNTSLLLNTHTVPYVIAVNKLDKELLKHILEDEFECGRIPLTERRRNRVSPPSNPYMPPRNTPHVSAPQKPKQNPAPPKASENPIPSKTNTPQYRPIRRSPKPPISNPRTNVPKTNTSKGGNIGGRSSGGFGGRR